jgi:hypothetical protein
MSSLRSTLSRSSTLGDNLTDLCVRPHLLSAPMSSLSNKSPSSLSSPFPKTPAYPNPRPAVKLPSRLFLWLFLRPILCASGTARNRPSNGDDSVAGPPRLSDPCWKLKKDGIPLFDLVALKICTDLRFAFQHRLIKIKSGVKPM